MRWSVAEICVGSCSCDAFCGLIAFRAVVDCRRFAISVVLPDLALAIPSQWENEPALGAGLFYTLRRSGSPIARDCVGIAPGLRGNKGLLAVSSVLIGFCKAV